MIKGQRIVVVLPAFNAEKTLEQTYNEIPFDIVDEVVLVDDSSHDKTIQIAHELGIQHIILHDENKGYGGNQKTCYHKALELGGDIIIMLHPDYQYTPDLIPSMAYLIANKVYPVVLGSRILGNGALKGGMPLIKYVSNRLLTFMQNVLVGQKLSEYHTGYRAFSREILEKVNFEENSDNFVFDNQMLSQIIFARFTIGEISCPTKYFSEASSINLRNSTKYAFGVIKTSFVHLLNRIGMIRSKIYRLKEPVD
jgi:glycosyltransferase involved in cell wall biosynthesis